MLNIHPCFNESCISKIKRLHLPVAPKCNIHCNFCDKKITCANINKPGIAKRILKPEELKTYIKNVDNRKCVFGIAGPGEALYNDETFTCLNILKDNTTCLCTNGLLLSDKLELLLTLNLNFLSITINSLDYSIANKIYSSVTYEGKTYKGIQGVKLLLSKQILGLELASKTKIKLKVNMVYVPGVNDNQVIPIAKLCKAYRVNIMNIIPLIPSGKFIDNKVDENKLKQLKAEASEYVLQKNFCSHCRADAYGYINGKEEQIG